MLAILDQDPARYQPLIDRVVGQIWDSVVDFEVSTLSKSIVKSLLPLVMYFKRDIQTIEYLFFQTPLFNSDFHRVYRKACRKLSFPTMLCSVQALRNMLGKDKAEVELKDNRILK